MLVSSVLSWQEYHHDSTPLGMAYPHIMIFFTLQTPICVLALFGYRSSPSWVAVETVAFQVHSNPRAKAGLRFDHSLVL